MDDSGMDTSMKDRDSTVERMLLSRQLALHLRQVLSGGNWTATNLNDTLEGVSWQQAVASSKGRNSIAALLFHMRYYVVAILKVLEGGPLDASDRFSFDLPQMKTDAEWEALKRKASDDVERLASLVESLTDEQLHAPFDDGRYGSVLRNILGLLEHMHYHLGQIAILKKEAV